MARPPGETAPNLQRRHQRAEPEIPPDQPPGRFRIRMPRPDQKPARLRGTLRPAPVVHVAEGSQHSAEFGERGEEGVCVGGSVGGCA